MASVPEDEGVPAMSMSSQKQSSESQSNSFVNPMQIPFLQNLYSSASSAVTGVGNPFDMSAVQPMFDAAGEALTGLADPSAQIATQTEALSGALGNLFRNEINPAIESGAIAAGGFGGGRQGVAQGVAAGEIADAMTAGVADITGRANQQAMGAAMGLGNLGQSLFNMQGQANMGELAPLQVLAQIIGNPTVLQSSTSSGSGSGYGFSFPGFGG